VVDGRTQQLALRAASLRDTINLFQGWEPGDLDPRSMDRMLRLATTLIGGYHQQAAGLGVDLYRRARTESGLSGSVPVRMAARLVVADVAPSLLVTAFGAYRRAVGVGFSTQAAKQRLVVGAAGTAGRLTLAGARDTITAMSAADDAAVGWVRVTSGSPCKFCAMLASRGPAYNAERTASFQAHDHCGCTAAPAFKPSPRRGPVPLPAPGSGGGGRKPPSDVPPVPSPDGPDRDPDVPVLPTSRGLSPDQERVAAALQGRPDASRFKPPLVPPPSARELLSDVGRVAGLGAPDIHFVSNAERAVADLLRRDGMQVRSVKPRNAAGRTPDAVLTSRDGTEVAADFKTLNSAQGSAIRAAVRNARGQARRVVIDARKAGTPYDEAVSGVADAVRAHGADIDEIVVYGTGETGGFVLRWTGGGT
jgi:hypothetical protein